MRLQTDLVQLGEASCNTSGNPERAPSSHPPSTHRGNDSQSNKQIRLHIIHVYILNTPKGWKLFSILPRTVRVNTRRKREAAVVVVLHIRILCWLHRCYQQLVVERGKTPRHSIPVQTLLLIMATCLKPRLADWDGISLSTSSQGSSTY